MDSASEILEHGVDCRAAIVESLPPGRRNQAGVDLYAFSLTVFAEGGAVPDQARYARPTRGRALLYPGSNVPVKRLPDREDHYVVIDWTEALRAVEQSTPGR